MSGTFDEWDLPDVAAIDIEVTEDDCDLLGHANNATYLKWCERIGWAHTESLGLRWEHWRELGRAMAVREVRLRYEAPAHAGEILSGGVWVIANNGRVRATRRFQIVRPADGATLLRGEIDYVCIDIDSGRPRRQPEEFVRAYRRLDSVAAALAAE